MGGRRGIPPGQRWRSNVDGHTVVTVGRGARHVFVRFEATRVTAAMDLAEFSDDYTFVEIVETVAS